MELWIKELLNNINRRKIFVWFAEEHIREKNLNVEDIELAELTVRIGKIDDEKSNEIKKRICFKNYFRDKGKTYFVIAECYPNSFKIITINTKQGKY